MIIHNPLLSIIDECRVKQHMVSYSAGVYISHFSCLWELMVALLDVVVAIMYLEAQGKLHRDISHTNILLREPGTYGKETQESRDKLIKELGLSEIDKLRKELKCREGLLIDYDYGGTIPESEMHPEPTQTATGIPPKALNGRTASAPFIAIELLIFGVPHRVAHDLESIVYVLLFIASHLKGPFNTVRDPPLYGRGNINHPSAMKQWLGSNTVTSLGNTKFSHMVAFFEPMVLEHISPYFKPLLPYLA